MDFAINGAYRDVKTTSTFSYTSGKKDKDYILQGSMYRYIMPELIWQDTMRIEFIFTDWQKQSAKQNPNYPQKRILFKDIPLMSLEKTEQWIRSKLMQFQKYRNALESELPECTDEELWRSAPEFKYYSDPTKTQGRSTKNFDDLNEARKYAAEKGKGVVMTVPGEVKRCNYCAAFPICQQKNRYFQ